MSGAAWRRATRDDIPSLSAFLASREERCAGFTGRLLRDDAAHGRSLASDEAPQRLRLPTPIRGGVWVAETETGLSGALLCHPSGLAFPVLPESEEGDASLGRELARLSAARIWRAASVTGLAGDVERLEAIAGLDPIFKVGYILMSLPSSALGVGLAAAARRSEARAAGNLVVRRAGPADLAALAPVQEAYEREEVLTPIHEFNAAASRAALARSLELQLVYVAVEDGRIVAKAGTNARGFGIDQIGGVYTIPERRGRGLATALMAALLGEIRRAGRCVALFVKPGNAAALALYRALAFREIGDYRADYLLD